jgi:RHS repeat-associated protein
MYDGAAQQVFLAHRFTGKERDSESGLDNFGARYDASSMGRFMTPDPLPWVDWQHGNKEERQHFADFISNPQNFNMYAYVDNNPTSKTDPTGMEGCKAGDKTFSTCTIKIVYDPKTSHGTLTVLGQNKGDKDPTVLLTSSVVVGADGHVTPTGTFRRQSGRKITSRRSTATRRTLHGARLSWVAMLSGHTSCT